MISASESDTTTTTSAASQGGGSKQDEVNIIINNVPSSYKADPDHDDEHRECTADAAQTNSDSKRGQLDVTHVSLIGAVESDSDDGSVISACEDPSESNFLSKSRLNLSARTTMVSLRSNRMASSRSTIISSISSVLGSFGSLASFLPSNKIDVLSQPLDAKCRVMSASMQRSTNRVNFESNSDIDEFNSLVSLSNFVSTTKVSSSTRTFHIKEGRRRTRGVTSRKLVSLADFGMAPQGDGEVVDDGRHSDFISQSIMKTLHRRESMANSNDPWLEQDSKSVGSCATRHLFDHQLDSLDLIDDQGDDEEIEDEDEVKSDDNFTDEEMINIETKEKDKFQQEDNKEKQEPTVKDEKDTVQDSDDSEHSDEYTETQEESNNLSLSAVSNALNFVKSLAQQANSRRVSKVRPMSPSSSKSSKFRSAVKKVLLIKGLADLAQDHSMKPSPLHQNEPVRAMKSSWLTLYVFISSTFRDMHGERDILTRVVFPELNSMLETRRVQLVPVDLRWGVTSSQSANNQAVAICLEELIKSTYFIGMIGERYGWVPGTDSKDYYLPDDDSFDFLPIFAGRSVTHLEMYYSTLRHRKVLENYPKRAFFYKRSRAFLKSSKYLEDAANNPEVREIFDQSPDSSVRALLSELEMQIRQCPTQELLRYPCTWEGDKDNKFMVSGLEPFAESVIDNLKEALFLQFPDVITGFDSEADIVWAAHEHYLEAVAHRFIGREADLKVMEDIVKTGMQTEDLTELFPLSDRCICFVGEPGSGKSSLLCKFIEEYRKTNPGSFVIAHFVGNAPDSTAVDGIIRRLCIELANFLHLTVINEASTQRGCSNIESADAIGVNSITLDDNNNNSVEYSQQSTTKNTTDSGNDIAFTLHSQSINMETKEVDVPTDFESVCTLFSELIVMVSQKTRVLIIIDAINQLDNAYQPHTLDWLPSKVPSGVLLILSCTPGRYTQSIERLALPKKYIGMLDFKERKVIIETAMRRNRKTLDDSQRDAILAKTDASLPLYITVAVNELVFAGVFEKMTARILSLPGSINGLLEGVLQRLEADHGEKLVRTTLCLLLCSRGGLLVSELRELLATEPDEPLQWTIWLPLQRSLQPFLQPLNDMGNRGEGLLVLSHMHLDQVIRQRFLGYAATTIESTISKVDTDSNVNYEATNTSDNEEDSTITPIENVADAVPSKASDAEPGSSKIIRSTTGRSLSVMLEAYYHSRLADFFYSKAFEESSRYQGGVFPRSLRELPYHQRLAHVSDDALVVVRVRPFYGRELDLSAARVVSMNGTRTILKNPTTGVDQAFKFDYSLWSHDRKKGVYVSQAHVFSVIGGAVVEQAMDCGAPSCVLAYGQTGSGKTYTMFGGESREEQGLIPRIVGEIFRRIRNNRNPSVSYEFTGGMLELYGNDLRDLLAPSDTSSSKPLRIRRLDSNETFAEGLHMHNLCDEEKVDDLLNLGMQNRTVAATDMNAKSSRAHTVLTLVLTAHHEVKSVSTGAITRETYRSRINLVDLAGSERASTMGESYTHERLREGAAINQSLTTLHQVLKAITENRNRAPSEKQVRVPYRDSKLTELLRDSLGGRARLILVTAISPADVNAQETLSTLQFANIIGENRNKDAIAAVSSMTGVSRVIEAPTRAPVIVSIDPNLNMRQQVSEYVTAQLFRSRNATIITMGRQETDKYNILFGQSSKNGYRGIVTMVLENMLARSAASDPETVEYRITFGAVNMGIEMREKDRVVTDLVNQANRRLKDKSGNLRRMAHSLLGGAYFVPVKSINDIICPVHEAALMGTHFGGAHSLALDWDLLSSAEKYESFLKEDHGSNKKDHRFCPLCTLTTEATERDVVDHQSLIKVNSIYDTMRRETCHNCYVIALTTLQKESGLEKSCHLLVVDMVPSLPRKAIDDFFGNKGELRKRRLDAQPRALEPYRVALEKHKAGLLKVKDILLHHTMRPAGWTPENRFGAVRKESILRRDFMLGSFLQENLESNGALAIAIGCTQPISKTTDSLKRWVTTSVDSVNKFFDNLSSYDEVTITKSPKRRQTATT